jgi:hypothetical protein
VEANSVNTTNTNTAPVIPAELTELGAQSLINAQTPGLANNTANEDATDEGAQSLVNAQSPGLANNTTNEDVTEEGLDSSVTTPELPIQRKHGRARTAHLPIAKRTKGPLPLKRRTDGTIRRFVPYSFPTAKLKRVVRKKEVNAFPEHLLLAVKKHVCHERTTLRFII